MRIKSHSPKWKTHNKSVVAEIPIYRTPIKVRFALAMRDNGINNSFLLMRLSGASNPFSHCQERENAMTFERRTLCRREPFHYGTKPGHFETSKIHCPTSEGVSEVSEWVNEWAQRRARAKRAVRSKRTSERCERTSERTSEWPSTSFCILGCFRP